MSCDRSPSAAVSISPTSATLNGGALAPFASGKLYFLLSKPVSSGTTCVHTSYEGRPCAALSVHGG